MKALKLLLAAALVAGIAAALTGDGVRSGFCAGPNPDISAGEVTRMPDVDRQWRETIQPYAYPGNVAKTCGGHAVNSNTKSYFYGYKRTDGFCMTREVIANSTSEARMCANSFCTTCQVQDITGRVHATSSQFGDRARYEYCQ